MSSTKRSRRFGAAVAGAVAATLVSAAVLAAHDFWLVPNALTFAAGGSVEVLGQSGSSFPKSGGVTQPARVAEARIVGRTSDQRITDFSVSGKSLKLTHKPVAAGQYVVGVSLVTVTAKTTPAALQRYIALEGAPELAARYEQEGKYPKVDSVSRITAKYAKTIVEVGSNGARAFDKVLGQALEIVALDDPAHTHVGGTMRVRLLFHGKPVSNAHLRAGWGSPAAVHDTTAGPVMPSRPDQVIVTDADGVAKVAVSEAGLWNVRTVYGAAMQGMPEHWEVFFSTMVFSVSAGMGGDNSDVEAMAPPIVTDSADVAAVVAKFHASLAAGDSSAALALLADDVTILESGGVETKTQYRTGHINGDMSFAKAVPSVRTVTGVRVRGDAAWVTSSSVTQGESNGRQINSTGAELVVLTRDGGAWKIRAVHWSSRARRAAP